MPVESVPGGAGPAAGAAPVAAISISAVSSARALAEVARLEQRLLLVGRERADIAIEVTSMLGRRLVDRVPIGLRPGAA